MKIEYDQEEAAKLASSFKLLRKSNPKKKVPFLWVESAMDGMPRLLVGRPGAAKVKNSEAAPLKKTAKNRANIAEGTAWRDPKKGVSFSVLRGKFRVQKAQQIAPGRYRFAVDGRENIAADQKDCASQSYPFLPAVQIGCCRGAIGCDLQ